MGNKRGSKCRLCGGQVVDPVRYRPVRLRGRYMIVCRYCADEAFRGKFGEENKILHKSIYERSRDGMRR